MLGQHLLGWVRGVARRPLPTGWVHVSKTGFPTCWTSMQVNVVIMRGVKVD